ncbi:MAG: HBL/NHE enterotoxin family protein [Pseudomonadota bacterium]
MSETPGEAIGKIGEAHKGQIGHALYVEHYSNSILEQPLVALGKFKNLKDDQAAINKGLNAAKDHANDYLKHIEPAMIKNATAIENYFSLHQAVQTTLPAGSTKKQWLDALSALRDESNGYKSDAHTVATKLDTLHDNVAKDSVALNDAVHKFNVVVKGDNGILDSLGDDIDDIQSKIDGEIAGAVIAGLAIAGGAFMIAVGGISEFVTAGTSTALVAGGVAIVAAGSAGEKAAVDALKGLYDQKNTLVQEKSDLEAEVKFTQGINKSFSSLASKAAQSVTYATQMHSAWTGLEDNLVQMIADLDKGIKSVDTLQKLFLTATNTEIGKVSKELDIIKQQLAGVTMLPIPQGKLLQQTLGDYSAKLAA